MSSEVSRITIAPCPSYSLRETEDFTRRARRGGERERGRKAPITTTALCPSYSLRETFISITRFHAEGRRRRGAEIGSKNDFRQERLDVLKKALNLEQNSIPWAYLLQKAKKTIKRKITSPRIRRSLNS